MATAVDPTAASEISYIDYETFLSPTFSPHAFAATLISNTNTPSDPTLDLTTPLSRVLFDLQEIDTHIHTLTTTSSHELLSYTSTSHKASTNILTSIEAQTAALNAAYTRLEQSILSRSEPATKLVNAVTNLHDTTALLRELTRALGLARQLEVQLSETPIPMLRSSHSVVELRKLLAINATALDGVELAADLQRLIVTPAETALLSRSREALASFSLLPPVNAAGSAFSLDPAVAAAAHRPAVTAALQSLHLLGDLPATIRALLDGHVGAAVSALTRALTALTTLERALGEVAGRCRTVVAVEEMMRGVGLDEEVLAGLDTGGLGTSFFREVAAGWEPRVREVVARGGASARILKGGRERVREGLRGCVKMGLSGEGELEGEFEVAVMVGAVGSLGR